MIDEEIEIGYVISVSGAKVFGILVGPEYGDSEKNSKLAHAAQIGALVKVRATRSIAFGVVTSLKIDDASSPPSPGDRRIVEIDLFGESMQATNGSDQTGKSDTLFQRGVSIYPGLGETIVSTTSHELGWIYARPEMSNIRIGSLHQDHELPAYLATDELLGKHFAILGTTGTGKSCAVAVTLRAVLESHPDGHVVLLDPHNEYHAAFGPLAERINIETLQLPYWLLNFEEMVEVLCSPDPASREAESYILKAAMITAKRLFQGDLEATGDLTVDTPAPYRLSTLLQLIESSMGQLEKAEHSTPYLRLTSRIEALRSDRRFAFMFSGVSVRDSMVDILSRLLRIPVEDRPVTLLDLSGVPSEIVDVVVSLLCRTVFDFALWSERSRAIPVLLVCEEAHRYIPRDEQVGFGPTRRAISRIAKEGRKYGVSLCLVTQRPSELSETILSQCSTLITLRLSNERDQDFVRRALPESAAGMLSALPALRNQEAVVIGEGVTLPMRVRFDNLPEAYRPHSKTADFSDAWSAEPPAHRDLLL